MGKSDKVLIIVENLSVPFDRRVWMEATTLQKAGYHVSVISPQGHGFNQPYELLEGIYIYRYSLPPEESSVFGYLREYTLSVFRTFQLARKVWKEQGFNIAHICNPPDLLFLVAGWFKLWKGVKIVFDHHDLAPEMYVAKYNRKDIFYHGLRWAERFTYAVADIAISTNESHYNVALTRGHKSADQVFIVRSAPDLSRFYPVPANSNHRRGKKYLVGYMGIMGEPEGIDYLLRSIQYITQVKGRQDIHFVLIGDGPAAEKLKALATELKISEFVEFTGFVTGEALLERLSSCDVCVEPSPTSAYNENCTMNKILEYMALGKALVQFDLREGRRSAADASLYASPNDEIEFAEKVLRLIESPELRAKLGQEGQRRMRELLEWKHQAPKLLAAYAQVCDQVAIIATTIS